MSESDRRPTLGSIRRPGTERDAIAETVCPCCHATGYLAVHGPARCRHCLDTGHPVDLVIVDIWAAE